MTRGIAGFAASGITPSVYALISAAAPEGRQARWLATITSGLLLALATGAPAGSLLASVLGWRATFGVLAAAAVGMFAATWRSVTRKQGRNARAGQGPGHAAGPRPSTLARLRAVSVTSLWAMAVYGAYTYLGTIMTSDLHALAAIVAAALVCYGAGAIAGNLAAGPLTDRFGPLRARLASLAGLTAALAILAGALHLGTAAVLPALTFLGLTAYPFFTAQQARLAQAFPAASGSILAWNNSAMYAGILTGSALGGILLHAHGPEILALAAAVTALFAGLAAAYPALSHRTPT